MNVFFLSLHMETEHILEILQKQNNKKFSKIENFKIKQF